MEPVQGGGRVGAVVVGGGEEGECREIECRERREERGHRKRKGISRTRFKTRWGVCNIPKIFIYIKYIKLMLLKGCIMGKLTNRNMRYFEQA
ncbi:hypothetical protein HanXRQr2_Chr01g0034221 [Helianthus annuus]|uniref:Uncharacterized protein n=1 Tax=Helianthus annuus TaxID=4232 RepID=A0A9K3JXE7_HELAN|nr:hypothetical protein HanXRQr2_Chr01g0034221 [Helianthus annuus]KAJ0957925.1 hypothetical protein HanPSC8_Chr01g0033301 [Helianthus annuus]